MSNEARIIKIVAQNFGRPIADVHLDTPLASLSEFGTINDLDRLDIVHAIEEEFSKELDDEAWQATTTVRDFLRMVEPEGMSS